MDCCPTESPESDHLVIIGGGSAAFAAALKASDLGAQVTLINAGLPVGGTCVNVGCVPSKTLIRAAEVHHRAGNHEFDGIESGSKITDFKAIMDQQRELVAELRQAKYIDVVAGLPNFRRIEGRAHLVAPNQVEVTGETITATRILIATGVTPTILPIPGLSESGYRTNESAFELEELPESLIVLGGSYVALESAQMFARLGSKVTILQRSSRILSTETSDLTEALTESFSNEGIEVITGVSLNRVTRTGGEVVVATDVAGVPRTFRGTQILLAAGRTPNTKSMGLEDVGVELDSRGFVVVDESLCSTVPGIYAAGDVLGDQMFVYAAAYEGALAAANAFATEKSPPKPRDYTALPWVVFTDPQVAGVGLDEEQAAKAGIDAEVSVLPLSYVPRALAARDTRGFVKLIRDRDTDLLVGARILAPEGSELLMEISLAIKYGITSRELATSFHPYLTMSEAVKLAAISFGKSVEKLSCCAA